MSSRTGQTGTCRSCLRDVHVEGRWVHADGQTYRHRIELVAAPDDARVTRAQLASIIETALVVAASKMRDDEPLPRGKFARTGAQQVLAALDHYGLTTLLVEGPS